MAGSLVAMALGARDAHSASVEEIAEHIRMASSRDIAERVERAVND